MGSLVDMKKVFRQGEQKEKSLAKKKAVQKEWLKGRSKGVMRPKHVYPRRFPLGKTYNEYNQL